MFAQQWTEPEGSEKSWELQGAAGLREGDGVGILEMGVLLLLLSMGFPRPIELSF